MKIELLGTSFSIQTDEDPQYVQDLVDYFRTKVQDVQTRLTSGDPLKIAIVAGVLTADELFRLREQAAAAEAGAVSGSAADGTPLDHRGDRSAGRDGADESAQAAEITQKLIEALDHSLADSQSADSQTPETQSGDS